LQKEFFLNPLASISEMCKIPKPKEAGTMTKTGRPTKYPWGKWLRLGVKQRVKAETYGVDVQYLRRIISTGAASRGLRAVTAIDGDAVRFRVIESI
jgi:hypothetical protein